MSVVISEAVSHTTAAAVKAAAAQSRGKADKNVRNSEVLSQPNRRGISDRLSMIKEMQENSTKYPGNDTLEMFDRGEGGNKNNAHDHKMAD
mmetsp:Transcript_25970/g.42019  ORF Transcript_25970/g.42019 Transcript_25970/m.42019 type:complete len:91 (+) Transcript_25970:270-542(+)|eukprot:jgi/Bigna1/139008/aug1.48_g13716